MYCCGNEGGCIGGVMFCLLFELGEEVLLEGSGFIGLVIIDGVFEFNGVWGCVGVLMGVVFFMCGEGEMEGGGVLFGSCVVDEIGGCLICELLVLFRLVGRGVIVIVLGMVFWIGREFWSVGKNVNNCFMFCIILFWLWRIVVWFIIMVCWFFKMVEKWFWFSDLFGFMVIFWILLFVRIG